MFRICRAEFRKIFLKPTIFVVTGALIAILAFSSFLYRPNNRDSSYFMYVPEKIDNTPTTIQSYYNQLNSSSQYNTFIAFNTNISKAETIIKEYKENNNVFENITEKYNKVVDAIRELKSQYSYYAVSNFENDETPVSNAYDKLKTAFNDFNEYYTDSTKIEIINERPHVLVKSETNLNIKSYLQRCVDSSSGAFKQAENNSDKYLFVLEQFKDGGVLNIKTLKNYLEEIQKFEPDADLINELAGYVAKVKEFIGVEDSIFGSYVYTDETVAPDSLYNQIKTFVGQCTIGDTDENNLETLAYYASMYNEQCGRILKIVRGAIRVNALEKYSDEELNEFLGFEQERYYERQEELTKMMYLYNTDTYSFDYANTLNIDQPSNYSVNCYDFSFYAMRLCFFVIVIYVSAFAASTITGELSSGTMKMLATRPFSRRKILGGKLLAIVFMGIILLIISAIATILIGGLTYSFSSNPMLIVFNATSALVLPAIVVYLIMLLGLIVEMLFFITFALAISTIFRSQVISVAVSVFAFFATLALNIPLYKFSWLRFLPFTNIGLFKYMGGAFISTNGSLLSNLFSSPVAVGADFWFSLIYTASSIAVLLLVSFIIFRKREIK